MERVCETRHNESKPTVNPNKDQNSPDSQISHLRISFKEIIKVLEKAEDSGPGAPNPNKEVKVDQDLKELFDIQNPLLNITLQEYLFRIISVGKIEIDTLFLSTYIFTKIVWEYLGPRPSQFSTMKVFAASIWLSAKFLQDVHLSGHNFSKLLGFSLKSLKKMERALFGRILNYKINFRTEEFKKFRTWMNQQFGEEISEDDSNNNESK